MDRYRPILDAAKTFASDKDKCGCPNAERCGGVAAEESDEGRCQGHVVSGKEGEIITTTTRTKAVDSGKLSLSYEEEGVQEPSFPHELTEKAVQLMRPLKIVGERVTWYRPVTLEHLLELQAAMPKAKIVAGNTEVRDEMKFKILEIEKKCKEVGNNVNKACGCVNERNVTRVGRIPKKRQKRDMYTFAE